MEFIEVFGPTMTAIIVVFAIVYFIVSFAPVLWPAFVAWRNRSHLSRAFLFIAVVAALVYGVFSFLAFAVLLPVEAYGSFIAPSLESEGVAYGSGLLRVSGFLASYWWIFVPPIQIALTWFVTAQLGRRGQHICAAPSNNSFKPTPLGGAA